MFEIHSMVEKRAKRMPYPTVETTKIVGPPWNEGDNRLEVDKMYLLVSY